MNGLPGRRTDRRWLAPIALVGVGLLLGACGQSQAAGPAPVDTPSTVAAMTSSASGDQAVAEPAAPSVGVPVGASGLPADPAAPPTTDPADPASDDPTATGDPTATADQDPSGPDGQAPSGSAEPDLPSVTGDDPGFGSVSYPARPSDPPDDPDAQFQQDIRLPAGDHEVPGTLTLPAVDGRQAPAVLLLHGDFGDRHASEFDELEQILADRGIASLAIDFAGSGESEESQLDLSYDSMLTDANASFDYLAGDPELDPTRLSVLGFSRGGSIAATLAGTRPDVAALVSWSGAVYNGYDEIPDLHEEARIDGMAQAGDDLEIPLAWFDSIEASHPLDDVAGYTGPVLALVGSDDDVVDPASAQTFIDTVASTDKTLHVVDGAGHGLDDEPEQAQDTVSTTADWLVSRLGS